MMKPFSVWLGRFTLVVGLMFAASAQAEGWRSSNIELLHGHGYELGSPDRTIMTLEHAQGWNWGDIYTFVDHTWRDDISSEWYGEFYVQPSLSHLTGRKLAFGPVRDISLSAGINAGSEGVPDPYRAYLAGISLDFAVQGFNYLSFDIHAFKDENLSHWGWQFTPVWEVPFQIGDAHFKFRGFADILSPDTNASGNWSVLFDPQLLLDVGRYAGTPDRIYAGVEYRYWKRKFGINGVDEHLPNLMLMAYF